MDTPPGLAILRDQFGLRLKRFMNLSVDFEYPKTILYARRWAIIVQTTSLDRLKVDRWRQTTCIFYDMMKFVEVPM
jgi:hypothetical protein